FSAAGGYDYDVQIERILTGLGFDERLYDTPLTHLSGGQKTRALLAKLLLERPDLLIMDEPTNHLDIETVAWLEKTLYKWSGALLIVSHDRYFLDRTVNTIWEMTRNGIEVYRGNYSAYLRQRQERWEWREKVYHEEVERFSKELDFIKKNIARATTNARAVGRLRVLGRELTAVHELGLMGYKNASNWMATGVGNPGLLGVAEVEQMLKTIEFPNPRPPQLRMRLKAGERGGDLVLRTNGVQIGYPGYNLFTAQNLTLLRGECAALIGGNGTGKTTFLKTLTGELSPLAGKLSLGINVKPAYFSQAHEALNPENTVLDELMRHKPMRPAQARTVLGQYLFRNDDVFKPVGALSGGERGRLALAILAQQGANLLLLDEPTNHLDIQAQEVLQEALEAFEGTILLVSHDRYLIAELATQIWQIDDGRLTVFKGSYAEFAA
ncbi:MAG: ABC-F family ATP-binding cassette domain-containing protein, partial [Anaerolinea sp.]|nr:ABC-F family ATP-binding cassette domain-containing protein [Anaerolinea sp.]